MFLIQLTLFIIIAYILSCCAIYETIRWKRCEIECGNEQESYQRSLNSESCKNKFHDYGRDSAEACKKAELELTMPLITCTFVRFWRQGEPYRLYCKWSESIWIIVIVLLEVCRIAWGYLTPREVVAYSQPQYQQKQLLHRYE